VGKYFFVSACFALFAQADGLSVSFNRVDDEKFVDPYRNFTRSGHNVEADLVKAIESAKTRIWIAVYELRLPNVARALAKAHKRKIDVRLVTENQNNFSLSELDSVVPDANDYEVGRLNDYFAYADLNGDKTLSESELKQMDAIKIIKDAGIPVIDDTEDGSKGSGLMHHKFMVIDDKKVLTSSGNYTWSDVFGDKLRPETRGNANNFLQIENEKINKAFEEEFLILWGDGPGGKHDSLFGSKKPLRAPVSAVLDNGTKITIQFGGKSVTDVWQQSRNATILHFLKGAHSSVDAALFVWSEQKLVDAIPQKISKNVRVFIDASFAYRFYSELLDLLGVEMYSEQCKLEKDNHPWGKPALNSGLAQLTTGDLLHHKFAIVDSKIVLTGSHNWSVNADENNDEALLVIESPKVADLYEQEFQRLIPSTSPGVNQYLQQKIDSAAENCD
jgi:phosphatidylserine/phosphatidylglycerophosphate/cardiolipin synthase-like enzyme